MISILDVKKDARVQLRNGWFATVWDNKVNSHTRICLVEGIKYTLFSIKVNTEAGSVYTTDIVRVMKEDGSFYPVEHTPNQLKAAEKRKTFGF